MSFQRLAAIAIIFLGSAAAWAILGASVVARTESTGHLEQEVQALWGAPQRQIAPNAWIQRPAVDVETVESRDTQGQIVRTQVSKPAVRRVDASLESSRLTADIRLEHRQRGLLWYPTYEVAFGGTYAFRNPDPEPRELRIRFRLPAEDALYDDFALTINGAAAAPVGDITKELIAVATAPPGGVVAFDVRYRSRGMRTWTYAFADQGVAQVRDFRLLMNTNFKEIDFPAGSVSPGQRGETTDGWTLTWTFSNLISGQAIGMELPQKLNPGPFAARVTFFAPVSLLFFLAVMVMVGATSGPSLHPMHYWFIAAAFFAFHLLLAYLVDHVGVHLAFGISAAVSVGLVVSYLRVVTGMEHALLRAGAAQAIFLVLFSYAFFFEGFTGLSITIGAILTLFVMMQMTARVSWDDVFSNHLVKGGSRAID